MTHPRTLLVIGPLFVIGCSSHAGPTGVSIANPQTPPQSTPADPATLSPSAPTPAQGDGTSNGTMSTSPPTSTDPPMSSNPTTTTFTAGGPCGTLDYSGVCQGTTAVWCENGVVQADDCGSQGATCGICPQGLAVCESGAGSSGGSSGSGGGTCGSITDDGVCQGGKLVYCCDQTQTLVEVDCAAHGGCVVDATGWADCAHP